MNAKPRRDRPRSVGVLGCGAIGVYLGTWLSQFSDRVVMVGRERFLRTAGRLTVHRGEHVAKLGPNVVVTADPAALRAVDICIVAVRTSDMPGARSSLDRVLKPETPVVWLQNGMHTALELTGTAPPTMNRGRESLPSHVAGVVFFNVRRQDCEYRRCVPGPIVLSAGHRDVHLVGRALELAGESVCFRRNMLEVQAAKLLVNTINGICAATGLTTSQALCDPDARWCYRQCIDEGTRVLRALNLRARGVGSCGPLGVSWATRLPRWWMAWALRFRGVVPNAEPSTVTALREGRRTEIAQLNGHIQDLAAKHAIATPANTCVVAHVRRIEDSNQRIDPDALASTSPRWIHPRALRQEIERLMS